MKAENSEDLGSFFQDYFKRKNIDEGQIVGGKIKSQEEADEINKLLDALRGMVDGDEKSGSTGGVHVIVNKHVIGDDDDDDDFDEGPGFLGLYWNSEKICKFLESRGYTVKDSDNGYYKTAYKGDNHDTEDLDVYEIFEEEVQDIILNWLLKNG